MTAVTEARRSGLGCVWVLVFAILALALLAGSIDIPNVGTVQLRDHAVERHGDDAEAVRAEIVAGRGTHYRCDNDKEYITVMLEDGRRGLMAIENGVEKTSFLATQRYIAERLEEEHCSNGWSHP